jgi:hypothetical protein
MTKTPQLSNLVMVIAVAVIAYAADDTVHELIGHGLADWLLGIKPLSISTVALQSAESNKWLAAAGALANMIAGMASFILFGRMHGFGPWRYLLWLFGFVNLMNGTGYLVASALLNNGDWAVVIAGWTPAWAWRAGMAIVGAVSFVVSVRWGAALMRSLVASGEVAAKDVVRLCVPAYITGGLLFVAAAALNRITPGFILVSGAGPSFGLTFSLLLVPGIVTAGAKEDDTRAQPMQMHWGWMTLAIATGAVFIGIFGPGVRLP